MLLDVVVCKNQNLKTEQISRSIVCAFFFFVLLKINKFVNQKRHTSIDLWKFSIMKSMCKLKWKYDSVNVKYIIRFRIKLVGGTSSSSTNSKNNNNINKTVNNKWRKKERIQDKKNPNKLNEAISWNVIETTQDKDIHKCVSVAEILLKKKTCKQKEGR